MPNGLGGTLISVARQTARQNHVVLFNNKIMVCIAQTFDGRKLWHIWWFMINPPKFYSS